MFLCYIILYDLEILNTFIVKAQSICTYLLRIYFVRELKRKVYYIADDKNLISAGLGFENVEHEVLYDIYINICIIYDIK